MGGYLTWHPAPVSCLFIKQTLAKPWPFCLHLGPLRTGVFFSIQPLRGQWTFSFYKGCHHSSVAKKFLAHALQLVINTWWSLEPLTPLSVSNTSKARAPEWDRSGFNFKLYLYNWCALGCMSLKNWTIHFLGKEVCSKRADWSATKTFGGCHALELVIAKLSLQLPLAE